MKRALLVALVVLGAASPADAQPVLGGGGWRPPGPCSTGDTFIFNGTIWTCGTPPGITNSAGTNVIPKTDASGNLVASSWTDNGTTSTTTSTPVVSATAVDVPAALWLTNPNTNINNAVGEIKFGPSTSTTFARIRGVSRGAFPATTDGGLVFDTRDADTVVPRMFIDDPGNVGIGIGVAAPSARLHVRGSGGSSGLTPAAGTVAAIENTASDSYLTILNNTNNMGLTFGNGTSATDGALYYTTSRNMIFHAGGADRCTLTSAGILNCTVGIQVNGTNVATTNNIGGTVGRSARITAANTVGTGAFVDDGTNVSLGGTFGVAGVASLNGTATVKNRLTEASSTASDGSLSITSSGSINYIQSSVDGTSGSSAELRFTNGLAASTWMTIDSAGNVGIGDTTPDFKLGVNGTFGVTGAGQFGSTLGVTGLATLTGGFTLGANSSAGSHKITSLANGTASSDAAAFGQIASAINTAVSGTSGRSARLTGTNTVGTGAFTDDGTNATAQGTFATLGNFTAGDSKSIDTTTINGALTQEETSGTRHAVVLARTPTNATSGTWQTVKVNTAGTFDTSGGAISSTGLSVNSTSTRATGGNALTNIALISTAMGGQNNRALQTNDGDVLLNASSGTTTIGGALTANSTATITGLLTATGGVTSPANLTTTGTGDLVSGDDLTVADAATIGGDVTINRSAGTSPSLFWKQSGQVDWKMYEVATANTFRIWNSSTGDVAEWQSGSTTICRNCNRASTFTTSATTIQGGSASGAINIGVAAGDTGTITIGGTKDTVVGGQLTVDGSGFFASDLTVTGLLEPTGGMLVENTATMTEAVTIGDDPSDPLTVNSTTTFNGPVFGLDGPGVGNGGWEGSHIEWWDEFMRKPSATEMDGVGMQGFWQYGANNSGVCTAVWAQASGHPGISQLTPSATGGSCSYDWGTDTSNRNVTFHSGETWTAEVGLELTELADGTSGNDGTLIFGFASDSTAATLNQTNGCYFAYDDRNHLTGAVGALNAAKWECWCASGGTRTKYIMDGSTVSDGGFTTVSAPVAALSWDHLKVVVTGTSLAEFYVDGVKSCQITSNIPTSSLGPIFRNVNSSATGTDITYLVDFVRYFVDLATARGN